MKIPVTVLRTPYAIAEWFYARDENLKNIKGELVDGIIKFKKDENPRALYLLKKYVPKTGNP
jgi:hypothetical protein